MNNSFDPIAAKIKLYWSIANNQKSTEKEKKYAEIQLHKLGEIDCDSDNCGRCAVHSAAEIAAERAAINQ